MPKDFIHRPAIAYFSLEIALQSDIPTYSGGLGVLAGDTVRSSADLSVPLVAVSLVNRLGYFQQEIDGKGRQEEHPDGWSPARWAAPLEARISVIIEGRNVWIGGWLYIVNGSDGGKVPVVLLDTDLPENSDEDRSITHFLYGGDERYRLIQEVVLGIGGVRMLQALGFEIRHYHMNEGHSALLAVELLRRFAYPRGPLQAGEPPYDLVRVRELCIFTTHTPVEAGHDRFSYELVSQILGNDLIDLSLLKRLAGEDVLNMTRLALNLSLYVNGVAKRHAEVSRGMYPGYRVSSVTNGVHPFTWTTQSFKNLYDAHLPGWRHEPELLVHADRIADALIWEAHLQAKRNLIEKIDKVLPGRFDLRVPILGFARRMTAYKRPDLLFSSLERLKALAQRWPVQIVLAGKAHPRDYGGKLLIEQLHLWLQNLSSTIPIVYLPDYDMEMGLALVSGSDLWLNTPLRPLEASGTSGMKAAFNGVPQLSVLDGWWIEGCIEGVTGWAIGDSSEEANRVDAVNLYRKLEEVVLPLFYKDPTEWIRVMKGAISKNASFFNSHRMMRRYVTEAYLR